MFSEYWEIYETYLKEIEKLYNKWKLQSKNNEIDSNFAFKITFHIEDSLPQN